MKLVQMQNLRVEAKTRQICPTYKITPHWRSRLYTKLILKNILYFICLFVGFCLCPIRIIPNSLFTIKRVKIEISNFVCFFHSYFGFLCFIFLLLHHMLSVDFQFELEFAYVCSFTALLGICCSEIDFLRFPFICSHVNCSMMES